MKKLVVLTGSGISEESGIPTFRASDGLWEGHDVTAVASPDGWEANPELVLDFYNQRRRKASTAKPNRAHEILAELELYFDVVVVTQNIDGLHEQAGSSNVIHLHGEITKSESTADSSLVYEIKGTEINLGDSCELGSQLRPHIVWFGEPVPQMQAAIIHARQADYFLIVGTSLIVYPAAGLIDFVSKDTKKYVVDLKLPPIPSVKNLTLVEAKASVGMGQVREMLLRELL